MAKRKTVITIETHSLTVMQTRGHSARLWCSACGHSRLMLTVKQAASVCSVSERAIFRLVESSRVHFHETDAGGLLICAESLHRPSESSEKN